jgi:hypothetical protein
MRRRVRRCGRRLRVERQLLRRDALRSQSRGRRGAALRLPRVAVRGGVRFVHEQRRLLPRNVVRLAAGKQPRRLRTLRRRLERGLGGFQRIEWVGGIERVRRLERLGRIGWIERVRRIERLGWIERCARTDMLAVRPALSGGERLLQRYPVHEWPVCVPARPVMRRTYAESGSPVSSRADH